MSKLCPIASEEIDHVPKLLGISLVMLMDDDFFSVVLWPLLSLGISSNCGSRCREKFRFQWIGSSLFAISKKTRYFVIHRHISKILMESNKERWNVNFMYRWLHLHTLLKTLRFIRHLPYTYNGANHSSHHTTETKNLHYPHHLDSNEMFVHTWNDKWIFPTM